VNNTVRVTVFTSSWNDYRFGKFLNPWMVLFDSPSHMLLPHSYYLINWKMIGAEDLVSLTFLTVEIHIMSAVIA